MITERNCNGYDDSKVFISILLIPFFIFLFSYFSRCCKKLPVGCITPRESNQPTPMQLADFTYCHVDRNPFPNNSNNCLFFHRDKNMRTISGKVSLNASTVSHTFANK